MNLTISGHHLEITPALNDYVSSKLQRIKRHFDQVIDVRMLLSINNQKEKEKRQHAECSLHVKGHDIRAESSHQDMYAAIDGLIDKLDRQIIRYKDKLRDYAGGRKHVAQPEEG